MPVTELITPIDALDQLTRLNEEISDCCQHLKMNDKNAVLVITEGFLGAFAI